MEGKIWLKRVLIPFWVIEIIWFLCMLVISGIDLNFHISDPELQEDIDIAGAILIALSSISIILDITAIFLFARHKLTPTVYLVFQCVKSLFWTIIFLLDIISAVIGGENIGSFIWTTIVFATSIGQLAYGSVIVHRTRKGYYRRGAYRGVEAADGAGGRLNAGYESPPRNSYAGYNPHGAPPNPFRDPSPRPSTTTQEPQATHPAFRPASTGGEASSYYDAGRLDPAHPEHSSALNAEQSYEMQNTAYRSS